MLADRTLLLFKHLKALVAQHHVQTVLEDDVAAVRHADHAGLLLFAVGHLQEFEPFVGFLDWLGPPFVYPPAIVEDNSSCDHNTYCFRMLQECQDLYYLFAGCCSYYWSKVSTVVQLAHQHQPHIFGKFYLGLKASTCYAIDEHKALA